MGGSIEYVIALGGVSEQGVHLRCIGKVLRAQAAENDDSLYDIAATLERYEFVRPE